MFGYFFCKLWSNLVEQVQLTLNNALVSDTAHVVGKILVKTLAFVFGQDLFDQFTRLREMVVVVVRDAYLHSHGRYEFSEQNHKQAGIAGALASLAFVGIHVLTEARLFSTMGLVSVTNPFGYAAIAAFLLADVTYIMNKVRHLAQLTLYINGSMTAGITLVYYHVASLAPIRGSLLFFIPFTAVLIWTIAQYGVQVSSALKTRRQSA